MTHDEHENAPLRVPQRRLGSSDVELSALCLGTMRLLPARVTLEDGVALLGRLVESGVDSIHVSSEYESFPHFAEIFRTFRKRRPSASIHVVAKIGCPHFGEDAFDPSLFEEKVNGYLAALDVEKLDVVQWLLRFDLKQPARRDAIFDHDASLVSATVERLRRVGKLQAMVSFPYTESIALRALELPECAGLALYINPLERELSSLLDRAQALGKGIIAIRPLAAGRLVAAEALSEEDAAAVRRLCTDSPHDDVRGRVRAAFRYALAHPSVVTTVASLNVAAQADAAIEAVARSGVSATWFRHVCANLPAAP